MKENIKTVTRNPVKGEIVSVSKDLTTVKVSISRIVPDKMYGKRMYLNTYVLADSKGHTDLHIGNCVEIIPCKKLSKRKSWKVIASAKKS
ncbi:MAG: 30S ribosomal protein S17 [Bdellovibrionota bacterium]